MASAKYQMVGSSSVDKQSKEGFRFYLGMSSCEIQHCFTLVSWLDIGKVDLEINFSEEQQWQVNYLSWQVLDCKVSGWSKWSTCSKTCSGGNQGRYRKILVPHGRGGTPCST
jgi:hypothetical protein